MSCMGYVPAQILHISEAATGEPIEMATIISETPKIVAYTNKLGQVDLAPFSTTNKILIRAYGFESVQTSYSELRSSNFTLKLNASSMLIDEVVVSGSKWDQLSSEVSSKITTISSRDIALQNPQTAADLLGSSGKVFIQKSQQGGGSPMIRGFATNRLLYVIDGVRMNSAIFRGGNVQNVISLDPFAIDKAEVFFGPGSVIYGSDAIGGVMNFQTAGTQYSLNDKPVIGGKLVTRYSSANNEKTGHFDISVGWKKWAILTSISSNDYDDLKMGSNGPTSYLRPFYVQRQDSVDVVVSNDDARIQRPSGYSQINMMQKIHFRPNDKWNIHYDFHYSETSEYARYDRHIRYKNGLPRYGEWSYGPQKWMMNNLGITHTSKSHIYDQMTLRFAHQYFEESRMDRNINANERFIRIEEVNAYSASWDFLKSVSEKNKIYYGAEYVLNAVNSIGLDEDISTGKVVKGASRYPQSTWSSFGIYLTDRHKLGNKVTINSGVRLSVYHIDATFDTAYFALPFTRAELSNNAVTESLGVIYQPTDKWVISMNASTAFRSPNIDDIGKVFDSEPGAVTVPNPDLKAEYAYNADVSIVKMFGKSVKIDATGYYTYLQNALVRRDFQLNGEDSILYQGSLSQIQAIQNAASANVYGVQVGIELALPSGFAFTSDINYQYGEEELDDKSISTSRHAAPIFGVTRLKYKWEKLQLQLYAQYSGEKSFEQLPEEEKGKTEIYAVDKNGNPYAPAWYTLNFKANYQFTTNWSVAAGVENITDQRYKPFSSGLAGAGRNFILSVRANF